MIHIIRTSGADCIIESGDIGGRVVGHVLEGDSDSEIVHLSRVGGRREVERESNKTRKEKKRLHVCASNLKGQRRRGGKIRGNTATETLFKNFRKNVYFGIILKGLDFGCGGDILGDCADDLAEKILPFRCVMHKEKKKSPRVVSIAFPPTFRIEKVERMEQ